MINQISFEGINVRHIQLCIICFSNDEVRYLPLRAFICATAILRMVSLSGFRARAEQVGTMSESSVI